MANAPLIDLHCHSTASDGRLTPAQLVELARNRKLKALALTDHDTVAGLAMLHEAGRERGIETISGVEISAEFDRGTMHLLGFFVQTDNREFRTFLKRLADGRKTRNPQIIQKLNELGLPITMREVEEEAGVSTQGVGSGPVDKNVGRPHIAAVLVRKGLVASRQDAFDRFLAKGRPAYVPRYAASPAESIRQIHNAEGLAVLAHPPYLKLESAEEMRTLVGDLKSKGLDGIEAYYSTHTPAETALCEALAKEFDLVLTGGSDFHGGEERGGQKIELGSGLKGNLKISYEVLTKLKERKTRKK